MQVAREGLDAARWAKGATGGFQEFTAGQGVIRPYQRGRLLRGGDQPKVNRDAISKTRGSNRMVRRSIPAPPDGVVIKKVDISSEQQQLMISNIFTSRLQFARCDDSQNRVVKLKKVLSSGQLRSNVQRTSREWLPLTALPLRWLSKISIRCYIAVLWIRRVFRSLRGANPRFGGRVLAAGKWILGGGIGGNQLYSGRRSACP